MMGDQINISGKSPALTPANGSEKSRVIPSASLFNGDKQILIEHQKQIYRLRQTSTGKLILTK